LSQDLLFSCQRWALRKRDGWNDQHSVRVKYDGTVELNAGKFYGKGWQPLRRAAWAGENAEESRRSKA
jgi:hypothetical protein